MTAQPADLLPGAVGDLEQVSVRGAPDRLDHVAQVVARRREGVVAPQGQEDEHACEDRRRDRDDDYTGVPILGAQARLERRYRRGAGGRHAPVDVRLGLRLLRGVALR